MAKQISYMGLVILLMQAFFVSCSGSDQKTKTVDQAGLQQKIAQTEQYIMLDNGTIIVDSALKLIEYYQSYQQNWPDDSLSAEYLFKAIDISINLPRAKESLQLISTYLENYSGTYYAGVALFLEGFIYDQQIGDTVRAHLSYERLIKEYPDHSFADDAHSALQFLGKSPEEMILEFEQKNQ
ncbi:MAG: hypothetical protein PHG67_12210 [Bacteroidales bacterium]|jgi:tetratricopeptide (TPR) repeat protein|nr:hypothetical protein [Bacteroidales bacterium]HOI32332.1 hypothetical protein [Bacteroidales bacterium]